MTIFETVIELVVWAGCNHLPSPGWIMPNGASVVVVIAGPLGGMAVGYLTYVLKTGQWTPQKSSRSVTV